MSDQAKSAESIFGEAIEILSADERARWVKIFSRASDPLFCRPFDAWTRSYSINMSRGTQVSKAILSRRHQIDAPLPHAPVWLTP